MKKVFSLLLTLSLLLGCAVSLAEEAGSSDMLIISSFPPVVDTIGVQAGTEITVGLTTPMSGYFATELFGSNTADMDVRALLHGYSTVAMTRTLGMSIDGNAIQNVETQPMANGNRVYTITIQDNLVYNNGQRITAKDYAFSVLLCGAPAIHEIGGTPLGMSHILGNDAYMDGLTNKISGVRLLSDTTFSVEVSAAYLPFFYGLGMLNIQPYPISVIAPGCDVYDDGDGVYLGASPEAAALTGAGYTPGEFSAAMLRETLLNPETGYILNPRVTSGPYMLESYDSDTHTAVFTVNPNYLGNYESQKPHIERIVFTCVTADTMFEKLQSGEIDLLNKVAGMENIQAGIAAGTKQVQYLRTGLTFLAFACELGPTASQSVRLAIAASLDKRLIADEIVGSYYGMPVFGYYGLGQWMFNQRFDADTDKRLPAVDTREFVDTLEVQKDLAYAKELLVDDGWTLNAEGAAFVEGTDTLRYRSENGALVPLTIHWAKTEGSAIADRLEVLLRESFAELGIGLETTEMAFDDILPHYYRQEERTYNMLFMASNFNYIFDPYYDYNTADVYQGMINTSGLKDEKLMTLALDMRETVPTDMHSYIVKWMAFQSRFAEVMPLVPLYSNLYYDFYANTLQNYNITLHPGWALAIPYAYIGETPVDATRVETGDSGDLGTGEVVIVIE